MAKKNNNWLPSSQVFKLLKCPTQEKEKELKHHLDIIKEYLSKTKKASKALEGIFENGQLTIADGLLDGYAKLLRDTFDDKHDWIWWYIWENDFGRNKYKPIGSAKPIKNTKDLLKLIRK